jgi:predicted transcriptional regulator
MSKASRLNYLEQLYSGNLEQNAVAILDYIKKNGPLSTLELRNELIYPHQTLTSRLTVLMDFGLIKIVDTIKHEIEGRKRSYSVYDFVYNEIEQITLQDERETEKANQWLKGYEKYKDVLKISLIKY